MYPQILGIAGSPVGRQIRFAQEIETREIRIHAGRPRDLTKLTDAYGIDIGKSVEHQGFNVEFDGEGKLLLAWYGMEVLD